MDIYIYNYIYITIVYHRIPQLYMGISWDMIGIKSWDLLGGSSHGSGKLRLRIVSPHSAGVIPSKKMEFRGEWNKILGNLEAFFL